MSRLRRRWYGWARSRKPGGVPTRRVFVAFFFGLFAALLGAEGSDVDTIPGLIAVYRQDQRQIVRIEHRPAFYYRRGEVPHPDLRVGAWSAHWIGLIDIVRPGKYRFSVRTRGRVRLRIGDQEVLSGSADTGRRITGPWVRLRAALLPVLLYYDAPRTGPAQLQLWWESEFFPAEPVPGRVLKHSSKHETQDLQTWSAIERGRGLSWTLNCVACHRSPEDRALLPLADPLPAPDLSQIGTRARKAWLYHWILSPQKLRPDTWMPAVLPEGPDGTVAAQAIAEFLASLGPPHTEQSQRLKSSRSGRQRDAADAAHDGLKEQEAKERGLAAVGAKLFEVVGCAVCHGSSGGQQPLYRLRFVRAKASTQQLAALLRDPLRVHPAGRMPSLQLSEQEALALAAYVRSGPYDPEPLVYPAGVPRPEVVAEVVARLGGRAEVVRALEQSTEPSTALRTGGKELVQVLGCLGCHTLRVAGEALPNRVLAPPLAGRSVEALLQRGCLAERPLRAARYGFSVKQRQQLAAFLTRPRPLNPRGRAPLADLARRLRVFGCVRCHRWHGSGGLPVRLVDELRRRFGADHAEAVTPPPLTGVGEKLRTKWLRAVLVEGRRVRPWMPLRMPEFGTVAVGKLPDWFAQFDGVAPGEGDTGPPAPSPEQVAAGRFLVGKGGYGCISCHDMLGRHGEGTRGPDLASVTQRIRYPWFVRWMRDAQRIVPGTRMPTVFPQDTTQVRTVLGGNGRAQLEAIWAYLSLGDRAPLPEGLLPPQGLVIEVSDRPYLLRTFMPDCSTRAIAVGFPSGVSYVFDAGRGRLAYAWSGGFLDATPVWANRGGNPAIPLGPRFWTHPQLFPWYFSRTDATANWDRVRADSSFAEPLPAEALPPRPRRVWFEGYRLGRSGEPTFLVAFAPYGAKRVRVALAPTGVQDTAGPGVVAAVEVVSGESGRLWYLLGEGRKKPTVLDRQGRPAETTPATAVVFEDRQPPVLVVVSGANMELLRVGQRWVAQLTMRVRTDEPVRFTVGYWAPYSMERPAVRQLIARTLSRFTEGKEQGPDAEP